MEREKGTGPGPSHWLRAADYNEVMGPEQLTSLLEQDKGASGQGVMF